MSDGKKMSEETRLALKQDTPTTIQTFDTALEDLDVFEPPFDYDAAVKDMEEKKSLKSIKGGKAPVDKSDPWAPENIRLPQDYSERGAEDKVNMTIPCRRPGKEAYWRAHPDKSLRIPVLIYQDTHAMDNKNYLIKEAVYHIFDGIARARTLVPCIDLQGNFFLNEVLNPGSDGKLDSYNESMLDAIEYAEHQWIRIVPNLQTRTYVIHRPRMQHPAPEWPEKDLIPRNFLEKTFKHRVIESEDHPISKRILGID